MAITESALSLFMKLLIEAAAPIRASKPEVDLAEDSRAGGLGLRVGELPILIEHPMNINTKTIRKTIEYDLIAFPFHLLDYTELTSALEERADTIRGHFRFFRLALLRPLLHPFRLLLRRERASSGLLI
jgi:hypothetical protein